MINNRHSLVQILLTATIMGVTHIHAAMAQKNLQSFKVVVNSDRDQIKANDELTLREAISIVNNTLSLDELSPREQQQVTIISQQDASEVTFDFAEPVTIELESLLPPLISPGLVIDGTSHPHYQPDNTATAEIAIPIPVVSLTPARGKKIFRGFTISSDRITVKAMSIYGFSQPHQPTDTTPGGDIVVISASTDNGELKPNNPHAPPLNVSILDNWLGLPADESLPEVLSSFGIWLFEGKNARIQGNRIYYHGGSGIITSIEARAMKIQQNIIVGNGLMGMPHAIYLEGNINESKITNNLLCGNDGSGVYLFKPEGSIKINRNQIKYNGRRVPSAAIYLIGNDHRVTDNQISWQTGTGVTIAAYPQSDRNLIESNSFNHLAGLSIDLNTKDHSSKPFFKLGDGVNPRRHSGKRHRDTANRAINAPRFLSSDFYLIDGKVHIDGIAEPGSKVSLYQAHLNIPPVKQSPLLNQSLHYGPLSQHLDTAVADDEGKFSFTLKNIAPGTISAIASSPEFGTSEPALNAVIKSLEAEAKSQTPTITIPSCTTKPAKVSQPPISSNIPPDIPADEPIRLRVPTTVHFALDKSYISSLSREILQKIAAVLIEHPYLTIELQGHTDFRASNHYNLALSKRRAIAVRNYLLQQGVRPERMTIRSLGESELKKLGNSILEHAYNRRVEIIFRDQRGIEIIVQEQEQDLQLEQ